MYIALYNSHIHNPIYTIPWCRQVTAGTDPDSPGGREETEESGGILSGNCSRPCGLLSSFVACN